MESSRSRRRTPRWCPPSFTVRYADAPRCSPRRPTTQCHHTAMRDHRADIQADRDIRNATRGRAKRNHCRQSMYALRVAILRDQEQDAVAAPHAEMSDVEPVDGTKRRPKSQSSATRLNAACSVPPAPLHPSTPREGKPQGREKRIRPRDISPRLHNKYKCRQVAPANSVKVRTLSRLVPAWFVFSVSLALGLRVPFLLWCVLVGREGGSGWEEASRLTGRVPVRQAEWRRFRDRSSRHSAEQRAGSSRTSRGVPRRPSAPGRARFSR